MKSRCLNSANKAYKNYGGRGITICDKWLEFEEFHKDMGNQPDGMSIERIDNNKGYSKDNCKWATSEEQNNNRFNNHILFYKGISLTIAQWEHRLGMCKSKLHYRLKWGWSIQRALATL